MRATEWKLSEPPRRITALPALRQSPPASAATAGRLSKITPMTPSGVATRSISKSIRALEPCEQAADGIGQGGNLFQTLWP